MNIEYKTIEDMIIQLPNFRSETKLEFHQDFSNFDYQKNYLGQNGKFHFEKDTFCKIAQDRALITQKTSDNVENIAG